MAVDNFFEDVFTGNFSHAWKRLQDWWSALSPGLQAFVKTIESDEGKILQGLIVTAAQDVLSGGLTTASFVAAAKDVESKLVSQNVNLGRQTIFAALNAEVAAQTPAS
jgi:hypothetical protein